MRQVLDDLLYPVAGETVGEDGGLVGTHLAHVTLHGFEIGTHIWRQIDLIDHQKIALNDPGPRFLGMSSPAPTSITNIQ